MSIADKITNSGLFKRIDSVPQEKSSFNKVVVKNENELFFAHGSTIRYLNSSNDKSYSVLDISNLNFHVQGIQLNSSGTLLAAYDASNIVIISLSFSHHTNSGSKEIKTNSFKIGASIYKGPSQVIQLLWNKVSRYDSSLVVLSSDGLLRTFNIRFSPDQPESIIDLKKTDSKIIGLTNNKIDNPVSMCFGNNETLSGALTLYILNGDGDVFAIYPFVSKELTTSRSLVEDLLNETLLLSNNTQDDRSGSLDEQLRFATHLWSQVSTSQKEIRGTDELCVLKTAVSDQQIQGPFSVVPYPEALYDDYGKNISSLTFGDLHLLLISYQKNGLVAVLPDQNLRMRIAWKDENEEHLDTFDQYPSFTLVQHLSFSSSLPANLGPQFKDLSSVTQVGNSIIKLDFTLLVEKLLETIRRDSAAELNSDLQIGVEPLLTLRENETLEGLVELVEANSTVTLLLTNTDSKFIYSEKNDLSDFKDLSESSKNVTDDQTLNDGFLIGPYIEIQNLLKPLQNVNISSETIQGSKIGAHDHFLRELNSISAQTLEYIVANHKLALSLNSRLFSQKMELKRQVKESYESSQRLTKLKEKIEMNKDSTMRINERQKKLDARFQDLQEKLKNGNDLPLSSKEKQWFKEVKNLALFFNRGVKQNKELKEQLHFIKNTLQTASSSTVAETYTDDNDWQELNNVIREGNLLLQNTKDQLKENSAQFGANINESYFN